MKKQVIYLVTEDHLYSLKQIEEINKLFRRYDIHVIANVKVKNKAEIKVLLEEKSKANNIEVIAVLTIQNNVKLKSLKLSNSLSCIADECIVHSYRLKEGVVIHKTFEYITEGYLANPIKECRPHSAYFYKQFLLKNSFLTYADLDSHNMKNTSQAMAVSKFICDEIHFSLPTNLNFNSQQQNATIDFGKDPADFVKNNIYFNNDLAIEYGLNNLFYTVLNRGIFFKAAKNRREKNYWCPALNAGLPFTPKRDAIHEITYMAHDFGHFLLPDLLYTGNHSTKHQQTYIIYRMMSEAFTLVLADMVFVDSLKKSGFQYDYSKRKIYPLFEEFEIDLSQKTYFLENVKMMLAALVDFCLRGDDRGLYTLSSKFRHRSNNLELFKEKYMKFFCEDFKWTKHNYNCFRSHSQEWEKWWNLIKPLRDIGQLQIETIDEFYLKIDQPSDDLINDIFNIFFQRVSETLQTESVILDDVGSRQRKAFFKYILGQLLLLVRFENIVKEAKFFQKIIIDYLMDIKNGIHMENIIFCRNIFSNFLTILLDRNLINYDDADTFKDIFPVFEPCFAFYDEKIDFYRDLSIVAHESIYAA